MREAELERRLQAWAAWIVSGQRGEGYPAKSVLHESWLPPDPGSTPTPHVASWDDSELWRIHRVIASELSVRLRNTVVVHYCRPTLSAPQRAALLGCSDSTVRARLREARRLIGMSM